MDPYDAANPFAAGQDDGFNPFEEAATANSNTYTPPKPTPSPSSSSGDMKRSSSGIQQAPPSTSRSSSSTNLQSKPQVSPPTATQYKPSTAPQPATASPQPAVSALGSSNAAMLQARLQDVEEKIAANKEKIVSLENRLYPLIKNFPQFYPIVFHDIDFEIKEGPEKKLCKHAYRNFQYTYVMYFINLLSQFIMMIRLFKNATACYFLALAYFVVLPPLAFFTWYWRLYQGFKGLKGRHFFMFFITYFLHIIINFIMVLGIPVTAAGGLLNMIRAFGDDAIAGIGCLVSFVGWFFLLIDSVYLVYVVRCHYRGLKGRRAAQSEAESATQAQA
eukprot:GCRY01004665.1.p1 GENE.GCRY01004665.1~~GCRY01004665.1.p1  ORF type:complete len:358 (-),score=76.20 GCRY01004665.1:737-1732(-)